MFKRLSILILALSLLLNGGQSLIITSDAGTMPIPNTPSAYNGIGDMRMEFRINGFTQCNQASTSQPTITRLQGTKVGGSPNTQAIGVGCKTVGEKSMSMYNGGVPAPNLFTPTDMGSETDFIVKIQKDSTGKRYIGELWSASTLAPLAVGDSAKIATNSSLAGDIFDFAGIANTGLVGSAPGSNGNGRIAWVRWYKGNVPLGGYIPNNTVADTTDLLAGCEFEGAMTCTGANGATITISRATTNCAGGVLAGCFEATPEYTAVEPQAKFINATTSQVMTADASFSFAMNSDPISTTTIQWVSGPAQPRLENPHANPTKITNIVAGEHVFNVTVQQASGAKTSKLVSVRVRNDSPNGLPIYPTSALQVAGATASVGFRLANVTNATKVRITVRKPDGNTLAAVVCTTSPCSVPVDARQTNHEYQLEYLASDNKVLQGAGAEWLKLGVTQQAAPHINSLGGFNRHATYLMNNSPADMGQTASDASKQYFADRLRLAVKAEADPAEVKPNEVISALYIDAIGVYTYDYYRYRGQFEALGHTNWENFFLHSTANWSAKFGPVGSGNNDANGLKWMDRFNFADQTQGGVYFYDGTTFTAANTWNDTTNNWATSVAMASPGNNRIHIGPSEPYDEVKFEFSTPGAGCTVGFEYEKANGTYATVPGFVDGTSGMTANGSITFVPPSDWDRSVRVTGHRKQWWTRVTLSSCSTYPTVSTIRGHTQTYGTHTTGYPIQGGWCTSDASGSDRITFSSQNIEYDPTPGTSCLAKFKHHARLTGTWAPNLTLCNQANQENSRYTCADVLAHLSASTIASEPWKIGTYLDDLYRQNYKIFALPSSTFASEAQLMAFTEHGAVDTGPIIANHAVKVGEYLKEVNPAFLTTGNTDIEAVGKAVDITINEIGSYVPLSWSFPYIVQDTGAVPQHARWDKWNSGSTSNPHNSKSAYEIPDPVSELITTAGDWVGFDRGNRGPMLALAGYYNFSNDNTLFFYVDQASGNYVHNDFYWYRDVNPSFTTTNTTTATTRVMNATTRASNTGNGSLSSVAVAKNVVSSGYSINLLTATTFEVRDSDRFFYPITSISGNGTTATITFTTMIPPSIVATSRLLIEGTSNSAHNKMVTVATVDSATKTVTTVDAALINSSSTGGSGQRQSSATIIGGASGTVGTPFSASGISFTLTAGATPFVAGDSFLIDAYWPMTRFTGDFSKFTNASATLGSQTITSISADGWVTLSGAASGLAATRIAKIDGTSNSAHNNKLVRIMAVGPGSTSFRTNELSAASSTGGTMTVMPPDSGKNAFTFGGTNFAIGTAGEYINTFKIDDTEVFTMEFVGNGYSPGTGFWTLKKDSLGINPPPHGRVWYYSGYFPAMDIDIGIPDRVNGLIGVDDNGRCAGDPAQGGGTSVGRRGNRVEPWKTVAESATKAGVWRRDFTRAVVLASYAYVTYAYCDVSTNRPTGAGGNPTANQYNGVGVPAFPVLDKNGVQIEFFPLRADGKTDTSTCNYGPGEDYRTGPRGGCTQIKTKTAEGHVLMFDPIP